MANPTDILALDSVTSITGYGVAPVVASEDSIMDALDKYY